MSDYFNNDLNFDTLARHAHDHARQLIKSMNDGVNAYNEWQSFRAGRTNAEIATALLRTETEIGEMDACFSALKLIYDYANNQTPSQSDYLYSLRKFS